MKVFAVWVVWVLVGLAINGAVGWAIGEAKGRPGAGFLLGFFLGWIGWIIIAVMSRTPEAQARRDVEIAQQTQLLMSTIPSLTAGAAGRTDRGPGSLQDGRALAERPCPWCAEMIKPAAIVCRFCGREVERAPRAEPPAPRDLAVRSAVLREIRETAAGDPESVTLHAAINRFAEAIWPQRPITDWFFASAPLIFVARYEGLLYASTVKEVRTLDTSSGLPSQCSFDSSGNVARANLGGEVFTDLRPVQPATDLFRAMRKPAVELLP